MRRRTLAKLYLTGNLALAVLLIVLVLAFPGFRPFILPVVIGLGAAEVLLFSLLWQRSKK